MGHARGPMAAVLVAAVAVLLVICAPSVPPAARPSPLAQSPAPTQPAPVPTATTRSAGSVSTQRLYAAVAAALRVQRSFRLTTADRSGGNGYRYDIQFAGNGAVGTFTSKAAGMQLSIVSVGADLFVQAPDAQWLRSFRRDPNGAAKLALISGKYLQVRTNSSNMTAASLAELAGWANRNTLIKMIFTAPADYFTLVDRGTTSIAGRRVTRYVMTPYATGQDSRFELDVAANGPPLPVRITTVPASATGLELDFTNYGAPVIVNRPPAGQVVQGSAIYPGQGM